MGFSRDENEAGRSVAAAISQASLQNSSWGSRVDDGGGDRSSRHSAASALLTVRTSYVAHQSKSEPSHLSFVATVSGKRKPPTFPPTSQSDL